MNHCIITKNNAVKEKLIKAKGFTLIELMVTIVILGIALSVGIPGMQTLMANMSVRSSSDKLINSLAYARGESVARVEDVTICPANAGFTACGGATDWEDGWLVMDVNNNILRVVNNTESGTAIAGGPAVLVFDDQGVNSSNTQVDFDVSKTGGTTRRISVSITGSIL